MAVSRFEKPKALMAPQSVAMAVARFETRKGLMVEQANAIRPASLRARLLAPEQAARAATLFAQYVETRFKYNASVSGSEGVNEAETSAGTIENERWDRGRIALTADPRSQPASLYLQALNDVFDVRE